MKFEWDLSEFVEFANNLETFEQCCQSLSSEIAEAVQKALMDGTPVKTGKLQSGWLSGGYVIQKKDKGYTITFLNDTEYAYYVNYGHYSYNQFNVGTNQPYVVNHRTVPLDPKFGNKYPQDPTYVFGHFFVEHTLLDLCETKKLEQIIIDELQKWWEGCFNG